MIVSHEHRFIFMKTLKTAGTSVELALSRVCGPDDILTPLDAPGEVLRAQIGGRSPRNFESPPLPERLWTHVWAGTARRAVGTQTWENYLTFGIERNPWDAVVSLYYYVGRHDRERTFAEFLELPNVATLARRNRGITHFRDRPALDRVLRYEQLDADVAALWRDLGLPGEPDLPRAKSTSRPRAGHYRDLYDDRSRELVRAEFAPLIEEMGYEF